MKLPTFFSVSPKALAGMATVIAVVAGLSWWLGFQWRQTVPLRTITIAGNRHVASDRLNERVGIAGDTLIYAVKPADVVDRLLEDPWVASATVRRRPTGTLSVRVTEREPVAVLTRNGRPVLYLDGYGAAMGLAAGRPVDVPLLYGGGLTTLRAGETVTDARLLELLGTLDRLEDKRFDLISEIAVEPEGVAVFTTPLPDRPSVRVSLGNGGFGEKIGNLSAFWSQVVLPATVDADNPIREIDLRFDGQIITKHK